MLNRLITPCICLSLLPPTSFILFLPSVQLYHQSAVLVLQQLVDNWIMGLEGSTAVTPPVVRVTEFPSPGYETDGFWSQVTTANFL